MKKLHEWAMNVRRSMRKRTNEDGIVGDPGMLLAFVVLCIAIMGVCTYMSVNLNHSNKAMNSGIEQYVSQQYPGHNWEVDARNGVKNYEVIYYLCSYGGKGSIPCVKVSDGDRDEYVLYDTNKKGELVNFKLVPEKDKKGLKVTKSPVQSNK